MNYRSAAREIVILAIPQLPKDITKIEDLNYEKIILSLTRSLSDYAKQNIQNVVSDLKRIDKFLINAEIEHPDNEQHTSQIKPVLIPDTEVLREQICSLESASNELYSAIDLPELVVHSEQKETLDYILALLKSYIQNKEKINGIIEQAAQNRDKDKKWKLNRMVRLDRDILRIATTELLCLEETPIEVICDEAVKIADKYGGDESKKFINGVLRDVIELTRKATKTIQE